MAQKNSKLRLRDILKRNKKFYLKIEQQNNKTKNKYKIDKITLKIWEMKSFLYPFLKKFQTYFIFIYYIMP